jgi:phage-related minor tail protein
MGKAREALKIGGLTQESFDLFREQLLDTLVGSEEDFEEFAKNVETFADQAARNMQDAFADFFFDPFDDGLKSLVSGFADALKRMVANLIASDILSFLNPQGGGGFFGFVKSIFGRQIGGPVGRGQSVIVGERGREVFTPGASGSVSPLGSITFAPVTNINGGSGLDVDSLIPILEENNRKVQGEFIDGLRRGKFA